MTGQVRIGVGGWTYEPWRGVFYPAGLTHKRELEYASRKLTTIEINGTYYKLQSADTFKKWHDETPDDFVFALKAPRYATNRRVLAEAGPAIDRFLASGLSHLQTKLGPINWQFMPTKAFDPDDFGKFIALLPKELDGRPLRHAVEVRHDSFRARDFVLLAREYGIAVVTAGDSDYPLIADFTAPFSYVRVMGTTQAEASGYAADALDKWAERARAWASGRVPAGLDTLAASPRRGRAGDVFLYVISGFKQHNPAAAMAMIERLG